MGLGSQIGRPLFERVTLTAGKHAFVWRTYGADRIGVQWVDHAPNVGVDTAAIEFYISAIPLSATVMDDESPAGLRIPHTPLTATELWAPAPYAFPNGDPGGGLETDFLPIFQFAGGSSLAVVLTVVGAPTLSMWTTSAVTN